MTSPTGEHSRAEFVEVIVIYTRAQHPKRDIRAKSMKICLLGGDCPGLNAVIRGAVLNGWKRARKKRRVTWFVPGSHGGDGP